MDESARTTIAKVPTRTDGWEFCTECGSRLADVGDFCPACGSPVAGAAPSSRPTATQLADEVRRAMQGSATRRISRRSMAGAFVTVLVVAAGVAGFFFSTSSPGTNTGSGGTGGSSSAHTVNGTFEVVYPTASSSGSSCYVPPAWGNESDGDQVIVTDGSGSTVGTGTLMNGTSFGLGDGCQFNFTASGIPDSSFYSFDIDGHAGPQYSESQMEQSGWNVSLSLTPIGP